MTFLPSLSCVVSFPLEALLLEFDVMYQALRQPRRLSLLTVLLVHIIQFECHIQGDFFMLVRLSNVLTCSLAFVSHLTRAIRVRRSTGADVGERFLRPISHDMHHFSCNSYRSLHFPMYIIHLSLYNITAFYSIHRQINVKVNIFNCQRSNSKVEKFEQIYPEPIPMETCIPMNAPKVISIIFSHCIILKRY